MIFWTINEAHKQYSLLDTIFNYIFYLGPPGKHLYLSPKAHFTGRHGVGFLDFVIDVFLDVQNTKYS